MHPIPPADRSPELLTLASPHAQPSGRDGEISLGGVPEFKAASAKYGVLLVAPLPSPPLAGGIETGVHLLLNSDLGKRMPVRLFNTARNENPGRALHERVAYQINMSRKFALALVGGPRVVHVKTASGTNFYQSALYVTLARLLRRRVVLQLHGGGFREFYEQGGRIRRSIIRGTLRISHCVATLSDGWAAYVRNISQPQRLTVLPNALPTAPFLRTSPDRARFGIPQERPTVLFVSGRLVEDDHRKGLPEILEAMRRVQQHIPELLLIVAGPLRNRASMVAALGPEGSGWLHAGTVSSDDKPVLYRSVDLFALPSRAENMPNTVIEAMAAGLPVIATPVGAIPEMIRHGENGFLAPVGDIDSLAANIELLASDPALRRRLGQRAAEIAKQQYDYSILERELLREYRRLGVTPRNAEPRPFDTGCDRQDVTAPIVWHRRPWLQTRIRLVGRFLSMSPAELYCRSRGVVRKRTERLHVRLSAQRTPCGDTETNATATLVSVDLADRSEPPGFFTVGEREERVKLAREHMAAQVEYTIRAAESILTDDITLLGRRFQPACASFDWLADPELGRLWPQTVLDDSDAVRRVRADVKFVWEVNRQQFLVTLARAFCYSSDERYACACVEMVRRWMSANPTGLGVNWASNLEVAIRALSWVWTLHFLAGAHALDDKSLRSWLVSLRAHRDHLAHHLSTYTDPTNHLIGEVAALAILSIWLPEWERSAEYRDLALQILERELCRQVTGDGVSREQSTSYQRFVLDFVLQVVAIADRSGVLLSPAIRSRASAMTTALRELVGENCRAPRIGDGDEARGLPFVNDDPWDFADVIALGEVLLGDRLRDSLHGNHESLLWLAGASVEPSRRAPAPQPKRSSILLREGGYAILRSPAVPGDRLVFDCGPLGLPPHASHGHADLLSVLADVDGEEVLIDPGTFAYHDPDGRRNLFRSTRSHNTVEVGGRDQADPFDPFKWLNVPRTGIDTVRLGRDFEYVEAWHDGYGRLVSPVRHRRAVLGFSGSWLLIDWIEGFGTHHFVRWFHASPRARVDRLDPLTVRLVPPRGQRALFVRDLRADRDPPSLLDWIAGAPYSERYGQITTAPAVSFTDHAQLPALRVTLVAPHDARCSELPGLPRIEGSRMDGTLHIVLGSGTPSLDLRLHAFASNAPPDAPTRAAIVYDDGTRCIVFRSPGDNSENHSAER